ncbi:MAG: hypothetical protein HRT71_06545, partial [Flavobacteriales bacterium]|nr:hypothetical protein [Flavobacteriales bacterium]
MKKVIVFILACLFSFYANAQAPNWNIVPQDYQFTGTLTGVLVVNDTVVNSSGNLLGAFINGEKRGAATSQNIGGLEVFFLTINSNVASGEYVKFKVYVASTDSVYNVVDSVMFTSGFIYGSPATPQILSLNLNRPPTLTSFNTYTVQEDEVFGTVNLLDFTTNDGLVPSDYLVENAPNLVGGIVNNTLFIAHNGFIGVDSVLISIVDSIDNSIVYDQQYMLFELTQNNDSIYFNPIDDFLWGNNSNPCIDLSEYLVNTNNDSIVWEVITDAGESTGDTTVSWSVNPSDFQYSMSLAVGVNINGLSIDAFDYQLAAFSDDTLVGLVSPQLVGGQWMCYLVAYSKTTEASLEFKLFDSANSILYTERTGAAAFVVDGVLGNTGSPYKLEFGTSTYSLDHDMLCITLFDSIVGVIDSFVVVATEATTDNKFSDTTSFVISYFNENQPFIDGVENQLILAGDVFSTFNLDDYLTELDGDSIVYSIVGANSININVDVNHLVTITPNSGSWLGSDTVIFVATDYTTDALFDIDTVIYSVVPGITLSGIADQSITDLQSFVPVALNNYLDHFYNDPVIYAATAGDLIPIITNDTLRIYLPSVGWLGSDTVIVSVENSNNSALYNTDTIIFEVRAVPLINLPIELTGVADLILGPITDLCEDFLPKLVNTDNDSIVWDVYQASSTNLIANIDSVGNLCMTFTTGGEFVDSVLVTATEFGTDELYTDSAWQVIRYAPDNAPVLTGIAGQTIIQDESFIAFDLDDYLNEFDGDSVLF